MSKLGSTPPPPSPLWGDGDDDLEGQEIGEDLHALVHECQPRRRHPMTKGAERSERGRQAIRRNREIRAWHGDTECEHRHLPGHA